MKEKRLLFIDNLKTTGGFVSNYGYYEPVLYRVCKLLIPLRTFKRVGVEVKEIKI